MGEGCTRNKLNNIFVRMWDEQSVGRIVRGMNSPWDKQSGTNTLGRIVRGRIVRGRNVRIRLLTCTMFSLVQIFRLVVGPFSGRFGALPCLRMVAGLNPTLADK